MMYALTAYPLSKDYKAKLEAQIQAPIDYVMVKDLRNQSLLGMIKSLRQMRGDLLIPLEDVNSKAILPILRIIGLFTRCKSKHIIWPDLGKENSSWFKAITAGIGVVLASLQGKLALRQCRQQMQGLLKAEPLALPMIKDFADTQLLYINANLWFGIKAGGSIGHVAGVVNALIDQQCQVTYAAVDHNQSLAPQVNYQALDVPSHFGFPYEMNYYRLQQQISRQLLKSIKQGKKPQWIYQRLSIANYAGVLVARALKVPLVIEYNGSEAWIAKNWSQGLRYHQQALEAEQVCLRHADRVVTISAVLKDELIERGVAADKIIVYPNCVDTRLFNPEQFTHTQRQNLRSQYHIDEDTLVLTFIGTFGQWHGVDKLAAAIKMLVDEHSQWLAQHKLRFMLVGDGVKMPIVKDTLQDAKYQPYYTLTGLVPQQQAPLYLSAADILLSPHVANADGSRFFGSPTKLFEYMAMKKPIIASDLEQIGEVLKQSLHADELQKENIQITDQLAVLTEPGNVKQLVDSIIYLVENAEIRQALASNVYQEVMDKYTWRHHVEAFRA